MIVGGVRYKCLWEGCSVNDCGRGVAYMIVGGMIVGGAGHKCLLE